MKIGLVLGGGGTKGLAHIGVLKALNINIAAIAGCSAGAICGAFYAAGKTPEEIETFALKHKLSDFLDFSISRRGLEKTYKMKGKFNDFMGITDFSELKIPLYINATNISTQKEVVFSSGNLFKAIRASMSLPGVFAPYKINDEYYIDGGVLNQTPFSILPKSITHIIIVNVSSTEPSNNMNIKKLLVNSINLMQNKITELQLASLKKKHVLIEPRLENYNVFEKAKNFKAIIDEGERAAKKVLKEISWD